MSEQNMVERLRKAVPLFEHGKSVGQTRIYENQRREAAERIEQLERERDEQAVLLENATENAAKYLNDWQAALQRAEQSDLALAEARREGLREAVKIAENYEDVEDRSDGTQQGNLAMTICTELRDLLERKP
jgi:predicted nuclease with TOPRIM domain